MCFPLQVSGKLIRKCAPGTELVDWLMNLSPILHNRRIQAAGMWQALLEEDVLTHGKWRGGSSSWCELSPFQCIKLTHGLPIVC